jgi:hypothetical protein
VRKRPFIPNLSTFMKKACGFDAKMGKKQEKRNDFILTANEGITGN